jgi:hypothetical protein
MQVDLRRLIGAIARGAVAAVLGALVGTALTRALMRIVIIVAGGTPAFTWTGTMFIALFYVVFLLPGAITLAWSRARWPLFVWGAGAVAIPVQAAGIATTDLEAVGPFSAGQWAVLAVLFLCMAATYAVQAAVVHRVARPRREERPADSPAALVGAGGGEPVR